MLKKLFILQIIIFVGFAVFMFKEELGLVKPMHHMDYIDRVPLPNEYSDMHSMYNQIPCVIDNDPYTQGCQPEGASTTMSQTDTLIKITTPKTREILEGGKMYTINWNSDKTDPIKIEICTSLSVPVEKRKCVTVADGIDAPNGAYSFTVPSGGSGSGLANIALSTATSRQSFVLVEIKNSPLIQELGLNTK